MIVFIRVGIGIGVQKYQGLRSIKLMDNCSQDSSFRRYRYEKGWRSYHMTLPVYFSLDPDIAPYSDWQIKSKLKMG